jgi:diguanylate cyclase (GGDEF)-like protein
MKKKILLIIALIMIISTILRTVIVGYSFLNFSKTIVDNENTFIKEILLNSNNCEKMINTIKNSRHIKNIIIISSINNIEKYEYNVNEQTITSYIQFKNSQYLKIIYNAKEYYNKLFWALGQLIFIAVISLILIILIVNYFLTPYLEILEKVKLSTQNILKGHFQNQINTKLKGEAKEFVTSYNIFLNKLKESFGVIEEKYTTLIEKDKSNDPLNDAKETIEQLANIFKFKRLIEEDESSNDIFNRLTEVLNDFHIKNFTLIGIDNNENRSFVIFQKEDICCNALENFRQCRAYRLKKNINSVEFPNICPMHFCNNDYICIPFSASGNFNGILKINIDSEDEKKHIQNNLPYIKAYLNEVSAIIEAKYTLEILHTQSVKDPLTNLFNRRHLENILPTLIAAAQRRNETVAFLMIDMDWFKKVNDKYGHKAGDTVLKTLANILINNVRKSDIIIRYGGEEFLIILQNIKTEKEAFDIAEKIRKTIEATKIQLDNTIINKTISIGISLFPKCCMQGWECIKYADMALYKAKDNGRNQTVLFSADLKKKYEENCY